MELYTNKLNDYIDIITIENFDLSQFEDIKKLKDIFQSLFDKQNKLFFSFRRIEDLTDAKKLQRLKKVISDLFSNYGQYVVLRKLDDARFDSVGQISINKYTYDFLICVWQYFYSCSFFAPNEEVSFDEFIAFVKRNNYSDIGNNKLIANHFTNFSCIKDLGGEALIITHRSDFDMPDLVNLIDR